jgi:hypothetical protein
MRSYGCWGAPKQEEYEPATHRSEKSNGLGWFAARREVARAMALLSDGAFKVYMYICLTADRSTGRMKVVHTDIATSLKKSRRSVVTYLEELREHQICSIEAARNQHAAGHIEVCDPFCHT